MFKGRRLPKVDMASAPQRRQALEWLFSPEDWDYVPLDTWLQLCQVPPGPRC